MESSRPKVGVGLMIIRGNQVILGKRRNSHGDGEYGFFGGHLEYQESFEDCVLREMAEEGGPQIKIKNMRFLCVTNLRKYAPKHYIDIGMVAEWAEGEPVVMEPEKIEGWDWYDLDDLPSPLFGVIQNYVDAYKTGNVYFND